MTLDSRNEPDDPIRVEVPALVDPVTFERAGMQLRKNKKLSKRNATRTYLLRGLIRCASCGRGFTGSVRYANGKGFYYRCNGALYHVKLDPTERCKARNIPGDWLDALVWQDCRSFILNPGEALAEAREQLPSGWRARRTSRPKRRGSTHKYKPKRQSASGSCSCSAAAGSRSRTWTPRWIL